MEQVVVGGGVIKGGISASKSSTSQSKSRPQSIKEQVPCYDSLPQSMDRVDLDQFESLALGRLNVLRWIDTQRGMQKPLVRGQRGIGGVTLTAMEKDLMDVIRDNGLTNADHDSLSHFILRLAFCFEEDKRKWLLSQETALFEARLMMSGRVDDMLRVMMPEDHSSIKLIGKADVIASDLHGRDPIPTFQYEIMTPNEIYWIPLARVPVLRVLSLIGNQLSKVYIWNGFAYLPHSMLTKIITRKFRSMLSQKLSIIKKKKISMMKNDPRCLIEINKIGYIIKSLPMMSGNMSYNSNLNNNSKYRNIRASDIIDDNNGYSKKYFPLCMKYSLDKLKIHKHAKHGSRMQFGLFLKGIGLSLSESLLFWERQDIKFNKNHAYNIRHNYGKEGKRTDYSPYSCIKIINTQPGMDDYCGCPFKQLSKSVLSDYLYHNYSLGQSDVKEIVGLAENKHYQLACRMTFSKQHSSVLKKHSLNIEDIDSQFSHPNEYFDIGYALWNETRQITEDEEKKDASSSSASDATMVEPEVKMHSRFRITKDGRFSRGRNSQSQSRVVEPVVPTSSNSTSIGSSVNLDPDEEAELTQLFSEPMELDF